MLAFIHRFATWKFILLFAILFGLFTFYLFPGYQSQLSELAGQPVQLLDLHRNYDKTEVYTLFDSITAEGRAIHRYATSVVDMLYPLVYAAFFMLLFALFLKGIFPERSYWQYLALLPLALLGVDYLENFNTLQLLEQFPNLQDATVRRGAQLTGLKHRIIDFLFAFIVLSGIGWGAKRVRNRVK